MEMSYFLDNQSFHVDKLTHEIFSLLENKLLFGSDFLTGKTGKENLFTDISNADVGKIRILSIDGAGSTDGILAAKSLVYLESCLSQQSGNPDARIADFFDVATGSGIGGILTALLFTKGKDGCPIFTATEALQFILKYRHKLIPSLFKKGIFGGVRRSSHKADKLFRQVFEESTLKDTVKPVLIPCYDLSTRAPFLFSRTDAMEHDSYDFKMSEVCAATLTDPAKGAFEMSSVDKNIKIVAVDGGVAMNNPTSAAITHVLYNKQEFPFCDRMEDLLVVSLGNGSSDSGCSPNFASICRDSASDMVDESVSMALGESMASNYVRIQANGYNGLTKKSNSTVEIVEEILRQKNIESVLFKGKKIAEKTNSDKLKCFAAELIKEQERRKLSILPTVIFKSSSARSSSATVSTVSSY